LSQKQAFIDFSHGNIMMPLPLQLSFSKPRGDCHVKAGYKINESFFIIKVATGFYENTKGGLPAGDGVILIFNQRSGLLEAILQDGGELTHLRTSLAACLAAQLTPFPIKKIGIIGTGTQSTRCLQLLGFLYPKVPFLIWGRNESQAEQVAFSSPNAKVASSLGNLIASSQIIVTTTSSPTPLIYGADINPETHIICLGADEKGKQEIDASVFLKADMVIGDSLAQTTAFGDTSYALATGAIQSHQLHELGKVLAQPLVTHPKILITDLTGLAAQDMAIAQWVFDKLSPGPLL
jgi:ornithine cyclodeaminase